jgi:hypothetical protein
VTSALHYLAEVELQSGNPKAAEPFLERYLSIAESTWGPDHETTQEVRQALEEIRGEDAE